MNRNCSVVVLYEDEPSRQQAILAFDELVEREWRGWGFDVGWASFNDLKDPNTGALMTKKARQAEIVVFAVSEEGDFDFDTLEWIDRWVSSRESQREGALVGLMPGYRGGCSDKEVFLRSLAGKVGVDYLTRLPEQIGPTSVIPDSLNCYSERASQMTGVLDEILQQPATPPGLVRV